jgi:hypothetical protein
MHRHFGEGVIAIFTSLSNSAVVGNLGGAKFSSTIYTELDRGQNVGCMAIELSPNDSDKGRLDMSRSRGQNCSGSTCYTDRLGGPNADILVWYSSAIGSIDEAIEFLLLKGDI